MSQKTPKPRDPSGGAKPDTDTASQKQRMGGDDPPAPRGEPHSPRLPHERDESARATGNRLHEDPPPSGGRISQAGEDVKRGLVDTDRRGVPNDVPNRKTT
jgi:hypothetical protein